MAYEIRPVENLEKICRDLEVVAAKIRQAVADVRSEGLEDVKLQWSLVENFAVPKIQDWTAELPLVVHRYIRNKKLEAAGAALSQRRRAEEEEAAKNTAKTKKTKGKP